MMGSDIKAEICEGLDATNESFDRVGLLKAEAITVSQLSKQSVSFGVNFHNVSRRKDKCMVSLRKTLNSLELSSYILTGVLTPWPKHGSKSCLPGEVFLEDETGSILCSVKGDYDVFHNLKQKVFLTGWNYMSQSADSESYIEVMGVIRLSSCKNPVSMATLSCSAICVKDAVITLKYRTELQPGHLNIHGKVSTVSQIFRMKSDHMFLVKLTDEEGREVSVLVKRADQLHWQTFLVPGEEYIFTNLRATTVQKGTTSPTLIYVAWEGSTFIPRSRWTGHILTLKDWLKLPELPAAVLAESGGAPAQDTHQSLYTYQGTITDASRSDMGIYQLDNKIGLYVSYLPPVNKFRSLRLGCRVVVYNAHPMGSPQVELVASLATRGKDIQQPADGRGFPPVPPSPPHLPDISPKARFPPTHNGDHHHANEIFLSTAYSTNQPPKIHLFCCIQSCLKVTDFSPFDVTSQRMDTSKRGSLHMLHQYSVNVGQFEQLRVAEEALQHKLGSVASPHVLLTCLLSPRTVHSDAVSQWVAARSPLEQFLPRDHNCTLFTQNDSNVPTIPTLGDLHERLCSEETAVQCLRERFGHLQLSREQLKGTLYWSYDEQTEVTQEMNNQILVGVLRPSCRSGQLQLVDNTGAIDCVVAAHPGNSKSHNCDKQGCYLGGRKSFQNINNSCPFMQLSDCGSLVRIDRYCIVTERFLTANFPSPKHIGDLQHVKRSRIQPYLMFSMHDVQVVHSAKPHAFENILSCGACTLNQHDKHMYRRSDLRSSDDRCNNDDSSHDNSHWFTSLDAAKRQCRRSESCQSYGQGEKKDLVVNSRACNERKLCNSHTDLLKSGFVCKTFFLSQKESLMMDNHVARQPSLRFCALGNFVNLSEAVEIPCKCASREYLSLACHGQNTAGGSNSGGSLACSTSQSVTHADHLNSAKVHSSEVSLEENYILMVFQGETVSHYHVLHTGHFYQLIVPKCDEMQLHCKYLSSTVKKAVEKFKATKCIVLPSSVRLRCLNVRISQDSQDHTGSAHQVQHGYVELSVASRERYLTGMGENSCKIEQVLSDVCPLSLVTVKGVIQTRTHRDPEIPSSKRAGPVTPGGREEELNTQLGISTLENKCIQLEVSDNEGLSSLMVYMNLHKSSLPLGLIPGVMVKFSRLERRVSRKGSVYCQYIAVSSVRVLQTGRGSAKVTPPDSGNQAKASQHPVQTDFSASKPSFLGDLWNSGSSPACSFYSICDVLKVLCLSLKSVCDRCGRPVHAGACTSAGCSGQSRHLLARARLLIDDGSSTAVVSCQGGCVTQLLGLSPSQVHVIDNKTAEYGELFIQQTGQHAHEECHHPLFPFFLALCDSTIIKRQWKMHLSTSTYGSTENSPAYTVDNMALEDFSVKTFNTGSTQLETRCLPFLQLNCVGVEAVDVTAIALHHLNNMES